MDPTILDTDANTLELHARSLDAITSLLNALDASNDVDDVATRALLTVSGQLLVRRAAFFVYDDGLMVLRATTGVGKRRIAPARWRLPEELEAEFERDVEGVVDLESRPCGVDPEIREHFDRIARLSNGSSTVGVLLLGGWIGSRRLGASDRQLLRTMGVVIGTTVHRVRVQEELALARERLEQAQLMRKSVMDHVSHEFNTPLMVVKSVGSLLRDAPESERGELLDMHDESVERLAGLVNSVLRVAREFEGGNRSQWMTVSHLVEHVVAPWLVRRADRCAFVLTDPGERAGAQVDPLRVELILKALYTNACDAIERSGSRPWVNVYAAPAGWWESCDHERRLHKYAVRAGTSGQIDPPLGVPVAIEGEPVAWELILEVVDLGRGIPEADLDTIFEPFTLATNSPRLGVSGSGMGLSIAQRVAAELNGRVQLRSREGMGTIAALVLPASDDATR